MYPTNQVQQERCNGMSEIIKPTNNDEKLCDAFSCDAKATEQIQVSAGRYGTIDILVCKSCVSKFLEDDYNG